ncbi:MAG: hypothetical protein LBK18_04225 [Prevotellaceae bacterium]|nr:hypothetical protein [Prevotellaceae bacterium]
MQSLYTDRLDAIKDLYIRVKEAVILLEKSNKGGYTFIGTHNEVRNAFDHVMKMVAGSDDNNAVEMQYLSAKSHLLRAGYDAYELLCASHILYIADMLSVYKASDINSGFPEYYENDVKGKIEQIKRDLTGYRVEHSVASSGKRALTHVLDDAHDASEAEKAERRYNQYFNSFEQLSDYSRNIERRIPAISDFRDERIGRERKEKRNMIITIAIATATLIVGLIGAIIAFLPRE